ncbi:MAG: carbohydrate binding family 9 domain-containing protein [Tannerellaceae bacterium]|jgi:hypothetical protein|nr:carbohydrate binding family 9 domain-containing protein [Tannerellaceae bacterium]
MKTASVSAVLCILFSSLALSAQNGADSISSTAYRATRLDAPPVIDGSLGDDCWEQVGEWSDTFVQQQPNEGSRETEETRLKILYDDQNLYVAFRALDSEPDKINRWLSPRDQVKGDAVCIIFDSYDDKRTGFAFALTAAGTRADFLSQNSSNDDYTWNAVWEGKTSVNDGGWYAEFRIPLSQLRYSSQNTGQEWGMHAIRYIDRKMETDHLHLIPRNNKGFVFSFGRLTGISGLPKSRRIELAPYTSLKYQLSEKEAGNPYATGHAWGYGLGLDGKIGLSSDFTLDFTLNPDFGQVEADPSTINLTAFETYYDEKRPFFLEGKNIFGLIGETMFYSRRIGSPPQWQPEEKEGRYSYTPQQTHILSALKVSGKSKNGLSLGLINSLTGKEQAEITEEGRTYKMTAQPFSSYSVARVQQDINGGNTVVGGMLTAVNRSLTGDSHLSHLVRNAYTGAIDFEQYVRNREYYIRGSLQYSHAEGSEEAITALQRSPVHYFQRENAPHIAVDSTRRNLRGTSGALHIGRGGGKKIISRQIFMWGSPGFDVNDIGYLQSTDYKLLNGYVAYVENTPTGIFRNYTMDVFYRFVWDYSGTLTSSRAGVETDMSFTNKWYLYFCGFYDPQTIDNSMLRGGPSVLLNPRWGTDLSMGSDQSKTLWMKGYHGTVLGDKRYAQFMWIEANYRPIPNLGVSARLGYEYWNKGLEYVGQPELEPDGRKVYVMSALKQSITVLTLRMDYSITPDLSVQFYGNPFMSSGKYTGFKRATHTTSKTYDERFRMLGSDVLTYHAGDNNYSVTEKNGDHYTFDNPDFSFREFRFNLVARWEYRPNSIVYLVWGQSRSGSAPEYISSFGENTKALFGYVPANAFMLKFSYWFAL